MFERILCATDGSARSERALALAGTLAADAHATLDVVHVIEYLGAGRSAGIDARADEPEIRARIAEQTAALARRGVSCRTHLPHAIAAHTAQKIAEVARELDADVIVVGSRGHAALAGAILGSVTQRLMHEASCPVLALPPARKPAVDHGTQTSALAG